MSSLEPSGNDRGQAKAERRGLNETPMSTGKEVDRDPGVHQQGKGVRGAEKHKEGDDLGDGGNKEEAESSIDNNATGEERGAGTSGVKPPLPLKFGALLSDREAMQSSPKGRQGMELIKVRLRSPKSRKRFIEGKQRAVSNGNMGEMTGVDGEIRVARLKIRKHQTKRIKGLGWPAKTDNEDHDESAKDGRDHRSDPGMG